MINTSFRGEKTITDAGADVVGSQPPISTKNPTTKLVHEKLGESSPPPPSKEIHATQITIPLQQTEVQTDTENDGGIWGCLTGIFTPLVVGISDWLACNQRDGYMWQCVSRIHASDGTIYQFRMRDQYLDRDGDYKTNNTGNKIKIYRNIFPAIEINETSLYYMIKAPFYENVNGQNNVEKCITALKELGYKHQKNKLGTFVEFPDKEVLESRWKILKQNHPDWNLRDLTIVSSEGIATDEDFLEVFYTCDAILATGTEFIHDQTNHVLNTIIFMVTDPEGYEKTRKTMRDSIKEIVKDIEKVRSLVENRPDDLKKKLGEDDFELLKKNLVHANIIPAIIADGYATASTRNHATIVDFFTTLTVIDERYQNYFQRRFPNEPDINIRNLCNDIRDVINDATFAKKITTENTETTEKIENTERV